MKTRSWFSQAWTNSSFSERKPYPGWTAWQPVVVAAATIDGIER